MEKSFETKYGKVSLRTAVLDFSGTLVDGIEVSIDDELVGEIVDSFIDIDELSVEEVEELVENNCDDY